MGAIETLRKYHGAEGAGRNDTYYEINELFDVYKPEGYSLNEVDSTFEEGGRWTNFVTVVTQVTEDSGETAYFQLCKEVPATEMQDGSDCYYSFSEVVPKEVTVIQYVTKEAV